MFAGLAWPSHLIIVLAIILLLFGAKRIPELAKGPGAGLKELREGISTSDEAEAEALESEEARSGTRTGSMGEPVGTCADQRSLSPVFGIGMQEMVIVGLLFLVIFGPSKLPNMARDLDRFVNEARRSVEDFKEDLVSEVEDGQEPRKGRDPEASREPEENVGREEVAAIDSSAQRTERL